ncbi:MAG: cupin domain-containing protein [Cyanosarcina radialis HA8281-LM2]|jgi:quercetin dioxygenase-like cupin family protein|nr:cupin domain-containing protein [Cyanosarcina radialis HA8281-LM2]
MTQSFWLFGSYLTILADRTTTGGQYDLLEGYFPPGTQTPLHRHTRYSKQVYVLEGEVTIWTDVQKIEIGTGEIFLIPVGTPHVVGAIGDEPARGLIVAAPSAFARLVATVGTQERADPLDLELFNRISAEIGDEVLVPPGTLPSAATKM